MKKLLVLLFASLLVLGACGQKEESSSKDDTKQTKEVKKEVKKEDKKEDKNKEVTKKAEPKSEEQSTEELATNEQQTTQEATPTEEIAQEQQTVEQPVQQPTQEETVQDNYINQDAEFYDSLPQEEKDKMARQIEIQSSISEDDPRWDEQYEINMRDDISDAERERLSDQVWK
ncbi:hypothetical protein [Mammaliicoccus sciuri]|uniref:hypothetical protein n=1 Tax=Mammaliicoccus sciuri TaxID=1296 RepID=UPI0028998F5F|nr:hypothetical protein [Mammaliicoccus sciuri]